MSPSSRRASNPQLKTCSWAEWRYLFFLGQPAFSITEFYLSGRTDAVTVTCLLFVPYHSRQGVWIQISPLYDGGVTSWPRKKEGKVGRKCAIFMCKTEQQEWYLVHRYQHVRGFACVRNPIHTCTLHATSTHLKTMPGVCLTKIERKRMWEPKRRVGEKKTDLRFPPVQPRKWCALYGLLAATYPHPI